MSKTHNPFLFVFSDYLNDPFFYIIDWVYGMQFVDEEFKDDDDVINNLFLKKIESGTNLTKAELSLINYIRSYFSSFASTDPNEYKKLFIKKNKIKINEWKTKKRVPRPTGIDFLLKNVTLGEFKAIEKSYLNRITLPEKEVQDFSASKYAYQIKRDQQKTQLQTSIEKIFAAFEEEKLNFFSGAEHLFFKEIVNKILNGERDIEVKLLKPPLILLKRYFNQGSIYPTIEDEYEAYQRIWEYISDSSDDEYQAAIELCYDNEFIHNPFICCFLHILKRFHQYDIPVEFGYRTDKKKGSYFLFKLTIDRKYRELSTFHSFCTSLIDESDLRDVILNEITSSIKERRKLQIKCYDAFIVNRIGFEFIKSILKKRTVSKEELDEITRFYDRQAMHPSMARARYKKYWFKKFISLTSLEERLSNMQELISRQYETKKINIKQFINDFKSKFDIRCDFDELLTDEEMMEFDQEENDFNYDYIQKPDKRFIYQDSIISIHDPLWINIMLNYLSYSVKNNEKHFNDGILKIESIRKFS